MARHETEMHRQRRELLDAMRAIRDMAHWRGDETPEQMARYIGAIWHTAHAAIRACQSPCEDGLFADGAQMDLQDRKVLAR